MTAQQKNTIKSLKSPAMAVLKAGMNAVKAQGATSATPQRRPKK